MDNSYRSPLAPARVLGWPHNSIGLEVLRVTAAGEHRYATTPHAEDKHPSKAQYTVARNPTPLPSYPRSFLSFRKNVPLRASPPTRANEPEQNQANTDKKRRTTRPNPNRTTDPNQTLHQPFQTPRHNYTKPSTVKPTNQTSKPPPWCTRCLPGQ